MRVKESSNIIIEPINIKEYRKYLELGYYPIFLNPTMFVLHAPTTISDNDITSISDHLLPEAFGFKKMYPLYTKTFSGVRPEFFGIDSSIFTEDVFKHNREQYVADTEFTLTKQNNLRKVF